MTDRPRPGFYMSTPVQRDEGTPRVVTDLSKLRTLTLAEFREALRGSQGSELRATSLNRLSLLQREGTGIDPRSLPAPLVIPTVDECQTVVLLNGIQALRGRERVAHLIPQIAQIRQEAVDREGDPLAARILRAVDEVLLDRGDLSLNRDNLNPLQIAELLFSGNHFLAVADGNTTLAHTYLPLQKTNGSVDFVLRVDPYGGEPVALSPNKFLNLLVPENDPPKPVDYVVYQVP